MSISIAPLLALMTYSLSHSILTLSIKKGVKAMTDFQKFVRRELANAQRVLANADKFEPSLVELSCRVVLQHGD